MKLNNISKKIKQIAILLIVFLTVMVVFEYFFLSLPQAQASNNYIEDIIFYKDANDIVRIKFKVSTSFDITIGAKSYCTGNYCKCLINGDSKFADTKNPTNATEYGHNIAPINNSEDTLTCNTTFHYVAGNTYDNIWHAGNWAYVENTTEKICVGP